MSRATFTLVTAGNPGAIGIIQVHGEGTRDILARLIGQAPTPGAVTLADLGGIDEGLIAPLQPDWAQLMPHGGPRVMRLLCDRLIELGAEPEPCPAPRDAYPEAASDLEADMLATLAIAASPAAIDLLMNQPRLWEDAIGRSAPSTTPAAPDPRDHLVHPPSIVLIGRPNVGKSTLSNRVLGRSASITADLPGTTRDWVAGLAELPTPWGPLAVRWFDTPGLRDSDDPIERHAIALAGQVIAHAHVLIAVRDAEHAWPDISHDRRPDLWVSNKCDLAGHQAPSPPEALRVSGLTGEGLDDLFGGIAHALGLDRVAGDAPWAFSDTLRALVRSGNADAIARYIRRCPR